METLFSFENMQSYDNVKLELIKSFLAACLLVLGWFIGLRITSSWNYWQKRRELDLATIKRFQELYGEFLTIWRLWKVYRSVTAPHTPRYPDKPAYPADAPYELLKRACVAEGEIEAILLKIASERHLTPSEWTDLALFRQAYQQLRQSIRAGKSVEWSWDSPEYRLFKKLACTVTNVLTSRRERLPKNKDAIQKNLLFITETRGEQWREAVRKEESEPM